MVLKRECWTGYNGKKNNLPNTKFVYDIIQTSNIIDVLSFCVFETAEEEVKHFGDGQVGYANRAAIEINDISGTVASDGVLRWWCVTVKSATCTRLRKRPKL